MNNKTKTLLYDIAKACSIAVTAEALKIAFLKYNENKNLQNNINNLAKANKDLVNLNTTQQEKIESLLLNLKKAQSENDISFYEKFNKIDLHEKSKIMEAIRQGTEEKGKIAEAIFKETREFKSNITQNNILGSLEDYLDTYKEYLSTLNIGQLACLMNILMLWMIISNMNGLIINYYSNLIINRLNLEVRFPKLAKIILLRSKLSDKLIKLQIIYLYVIVLVSLAVNIYMFL